MEATSATLPSSQHISRPKSVPGKPEYTAFDRDLVKAQQKQIEITFWLAGGLPFADNAKGLFCMRAVPESVDKYMVKVIQRTTPDEAPDREIWLAKNYIVAVEMGGRI